MKYKVYFLFVAISLLLTNCNTTQNTQTPQAQSQRGGDPEFMADQQTAELMAPLNLTTEQIPKVKEINLKYIKKTQEVRQQAGGDRSTAQALRASLNNDKNGEMKLVLTDSQYQKYLSMQSENSGKRGGKGGGKGGGGRRGF